MFLFHRRRDEPFSLLAKIAVHGRPSLEHYAMVIPVKIRAGRVEVCFLTRWNTDVTRTRAIRFANRPRARPCDPGYRRYHNLKLTLVPDDPVLVRRSSPPRDADSGDEIAGASPDVVIRLVAARSGRVDFSVTAPPHQVIDTTGFDPQRESQIVEILDRLNHGDAWDRVDDL